MENKNSDIKNNLLNFYQTYLKNKLGNIDEEKEQKLTASLYIIFSLLSISFFGIFAINPTLTTISNLKKQYRDNMQVKNALYNKLDALNQLKEQYKNISTNLNLVYDALPVVSQIPYFTAQLQQIAKENNLTISRLEIGKAELYPAERKTGNLYSFLFQISAEGTDIDINNFIKEIISFERIISLDSLNLEQSGKNGNKLSLGGKAYFNKK